jgi:D-beta-D-heptose 7-phosphate kinase/D-beta-D-heptose 1-phosphate adenosyltransferase
MKKLNILLIGDNCIDIYRYGVVDRISPEAPVPVFRYLEEESRPGMAANVKINLEALGVYVKFVSQGTSRKTRLIDQRSGQHIVRVDEDYISESLKIEELLPLDFEAIVISDYDKGTVSYGLIEQLRQVYAGPIFVDTKKTDLSRLEGCIVKINAKEFRAAKSYPSELIVTSGDQGARYMNSTWPAEEIEIVDVTGAGDTFLSALAYDYLLNRDIYTAIPFAIRASAVTVQHVGVYAPTLEEIR